MKTPEEARGMFAGPKMTIGELFRDLFGGLLVSWGIRILPSGRGKLKLAYAWVEYCGRAVKRNPVCRP